MSAARRKRVKPTKELIVKLRLDPSLHTRMKALRQRDGVPFAEMLRTALDDYLKARGIPRKKSPANVSRGIYRVDQMSTLLNGFGGDPPEWHETKAGPADRRKRSAGRSRTDRSD
jgi:hypothetical protein